MRIDLLKRTFSYYRDFRSFTTLAATRNGERLELQQHIATAVESLLLAVPWVDSSLAGDILGRKRLCPLAR